MAALKNARHERFAQLVAGGQTADAAYAEAGYQPNRHNAAALAREQHISTRVAEILDRAATRVEIDKSWVLGKLKQNAETCLAERRVRTSIRLDRSQPPVEFEI